MSDAERLEQFRAVMLSTMEIVREARKDTRKLQAEVLALRNFLCSVNPEIAPDVVAELGQLRAQAERTLDDQKSGAEKQFDALLNQVIGTLGVDQKKSN